MHSSLGCSVPRERLTTGFEVVCRENRSFDFGIIFFIGSTASLVSMEQASQHSGIIRKWHSFYLVASLVSTLQERVDYALVRGAFRLAMTALASVLGEHAHLTVLSTTRMCPREGKVALAAIAAQKSPFHFPRLAKFTHGQTECGMLRAMSSCYAQGQDYHLLICCDGSQAMSSCCV